MSQHGALGLSAVLLAFVSVPQALAARTESVLYEFQYATGNVPGSMVADPSTGALYGTTSKGGANGTGVIFQFLPPTSGNPSGSYSAIYNFASNETTEAQLLAASGTVYALFDDGGTGCGGVGCGEVIALTPPSASGPWTISVLHQFTGGAGGSYPSGSLAMDNQGALYGVVSSGGTGCAKQGGCGAVFKLTPPATPGQAWAYSVTYNFKGGADTAFPAGGVFFDSHGDLYGSAHFDQDGRKEAIYELMPSEGSGWTETIIYRFYINSQSCGGAILSAIDANGALYGFGTSSSCVDYVVQLAPSASDSSIWVKTNMHSFPTSGGGIRPNAGLSVDADANIYGTTEQGGTNGDGMVYRLQPRPGVPGKWNYSALFNFTGASTGYFPDSGVVVGSGGVIYGTTPDGGAKHGLVYSLAP
jgi:uncharacterized repeat protein (TIGR03803 family)